ncbi:hypothetical protein FRX31_033394 [Thalictrum thalictroides]|uniref:Uncharacterized protein n=1 Tax=Thalictrum thalictroides TaxID=46969 RepID=A0A7J6UWN8_THATH|nr:hypothetical protein FRX31_033394 [Thalictrum thalictroides]
MLQNFSFGSLPAEDKRLEQTVICTRRQALWVYSYIISLHATKAEDHKSVNAYMLASSNLSLYSTKKGCYTACAGRCRDNVPCFTRVSETESDQEVVVSGDKME